MGIATKSLHRSASDCSFGELTTALFGQEMSISKLWRLVESSEIDIGGETMTSSLVAPIWIGSVGYERFQRNDEFARCLRKAGVERLIDVRELPISRRKGYAKTALRETLEAAGIEYIHMRALGNPKPFRDLYKAGKTEAGRQQYTRYLLDQQEDALNELVPLLREKRTALMCVEHDPMTCHRTVIVEALQKELDLELDVTEIA